MSREKSCGFTKIKIHQKEWHKNPDILVQKSPKAKENEQ